MVLVPQWSLECNGTKIVRNLKLKNFTKAIQIVNQIANIAESENHHPDLHLTSYRYLSIELWTHKVNGLSDNDFIMAVKIDATIQNAE
mmetsp:Transcript_1527/g.2747  ORF Transcript_1527/g.2747 Transcript_1527/m.2747 type:complete len:88 (-) Transcript_1527:60-323(-)